MSSGVHGKRRRKRGNGVEEEESSGKKAHIQIAGASRNLQIIQQAAAVADVDGNSANIKKQKK
jgi:hypothetical protein